MLKKRKKRDTNKKRKKRFLHLWYTTQHNSAHTQFFSLQLKTMMMVVFVGGGVGIGHAGGHW